MQTTIVIVTYDGMKWLSKCLSIIPTKYNVIIVDNNSSDETCDFVKLHYPHFKLIENDSNLGFGKANNTGIRYAIKQGATAVYLLNQDAYLFPDTIDVLEAAYLKNKEYGVLSPVHLDGTKKELDILFKSYINYNKQKVFNWETILAYRECVYEVPFVNAAGWFLPIATLNSVGGFDPLFFHYGEDENYCQRALYHNFKIGVVSSALMIHDRELRKSVSFVPFSEIAFEKKIRILKLKFSNVNNTDAKKELFDAVWMFRKLAFKSRMLLRKQEAVYYKRIYEALLGLKAQIFQSYDTNQIVGGHYL